MPRHKNDYGYWENVDRLPIPGCGCLKCCNAADRDAERAQRRRGRRGSGGAASTDFGTGNTRRYGDNRYTDPVHGTTDDGRDVTASFGREGTSREGHSLLRDGHAESPGDFYGPNGAEEHDHFDGKGGGTQRGKH